VVGEGVRAGAIGARLFEVAGELGGALVLSGGGWAHLGPGRGLLLGLAFATFTQIHLNLGVGLHPGALLRGTVLQSGGPTTDSSCCQAPSEAIVNQHLKLNRKIEVSGQELKVSIWGASLPKEA